MRTKIGGPCRGLRYKGTGGEGIKSHRTGGINYGLWEKPWGMNVML